MAHDKCAVFFNTSYLKNLKNTILTFGFLKTKPCINNLIKGYNSRLKAYQNRFFKNPK